MLVEMIGGTGGPEGGVTSAQLVPTRILSTSETPPPLPGDAVTRTTYCSAAESVPLAEVVAGTAGEMSSAPPREAGFNQSVTVSSPVPAPNVYLPTTSTVSEAVNRALPNIVVP